MTTLTQREIDVLNAFCGGCATAKEVARQLNISHRTVEVYMQQVIMKLEVRNHLQAVLLWDRQERTKSALQQQGYA